MGLLDGKKGIIYGVANKRSIAWSCAKAALAEGAQLCLTYQNERLKSKVEELVDGHPNVLVLPCDVSMDEEIAVLHERVKKEFGRLDFVVHSIAFANREDLDGRFIDTSREGFKHCMDVSAYSLTAVARAAEPLMTEGGSIITMTYLGAERVVVNYNVMGVAKAALEASMRYLCRDLGEKGIRINAVSAGPINTLAARGIRGFSDMLAYVAERCPLGQKNTEVDEVGDTALFLMSHLSRGMTGEVIHVDNGYHAMGF